MNLFVNNLVSPSFRVRFKSRLNKLQNLNQILFTRILDECAMYRNPYRNNFAKVRKRSSPKSIWLGEIFVLQHNRVNVKRSFISVTNFKEEGLTRASQGQYAANFVAWCTVPRLQLLTPTPTVQIVFKCHNSNKWWKRKCTKKNLTNDIIGEKLSPSENG